MPFIHVRSLPFSTPLDMRSIVEGMTEDLSKGSGVKLEHVTATWEFWSPGHYAVAGKAATRQPDASHPVLVDLLSPDFDSPAQVEQMLRTVASSIAKRANVPIANIFVSHRHARSGAVFDGGDIVRW